MKKYVDVDKIRNAIESEADNWQETSTDCMRDNLLTTLDFLQREQPSFPDDLDEAAEKYYFSPACSWEDHEERFINAFKAGAEWAIQQFKGKERR